jgi:AraC family transcriptional regulator
MIPRLIPREGVDTIVYQGSGVSIGRFRCEVGHPDFRDTGPIRRAVVVFPRTSVWIRHEGAREFVADPNVVTIYNRGQRYNRFPIHPAGDRCDWFALSDELARDVASWQTPGSADSPNRPFAYERAPGRVDLYARQRALFRRAAAGQLTELEAEEEAIAIVGEVLALAREHAARATTTRRAEAARRRRDLAEAARAELARSPFENRSVAALARALGTSPYHLCRVFKEETGQTMHAYRVGIRLRRAIDRLGTAAGRAPGGLSAIAHETGFASHAHFVLICRRELGVTPTELRARLG